MYSAVSFSISENIGPLIENIVFLDLKRRLKGIEELFYYKSRTGTEIDFVLKEKGRLRLIQVNYDLSNEDTFRREKRALVQGAKELGIAEGMIINGNIKERLVEEGITISVVPVSEFLLLDES